MTNLTDRIRRALEFDEKQCFNDWSLSHSHDMPFNLFRNGAKYQSEKLKPILEALISAVESGNVLVSRFLEEKSEVERIGLRNINIKYSDIIALGDALANIDAKLKEVESGK